MQRNVNEKDKAQGKDSTCLPVLNLPLWSSHHQFSERAASSLTSGGPLLNVIDISARSRGLRPSKNQNGFGRPQSYSKDSGL